MKSWRCRISAHRESKRTAFRLLQHNEKSSVPLKEVCTRRSIDATRAHRNVFADTMRICASGISDAPARLRARIAKHSMK
jgi:hypothetical protein